MKQKILVCLTGLVLGTNHGSITWWQNFADDEEVTAEVRRFLRQQSKYVYAVSFEAMAKRWDKCINVGEGYIEKLMFFQVRILYVLRFISILTYFLTLPHILFILLNVCSAENISNKVHLFMTISFILCALSPLFNRMSSVSET
jgi:hypothetical protein